MATWPPCTPFLGHIQILKQKLWIHKYTETGPVLHVKVSVNTTLMESRFGSLQQLEIKPMYGWSYPEAEIVT